MPPYLQKLDEALFHFINKALTNFLCDAIFPAFNTAAPFIPILAIMLAWLAYNHSRRLWLLALALLAGITLGDTLVFNPLKDLIARPRPAATSMEVRSLVSGPAGGNSFPSSHTANAFAAAAILGAVFPARRKLFLAIAAIIGFSRIYVGVHYPSDVAGSAILGWLYGIAFLFVARRLWSKISPSLPQPGKLIAPTLLHSPWLPWLALGLIQLTRLAWAGTVDLDVPPEAARLWCVATDAKGFTFASLWFTCFGSSPLSLWAIPWTLQTLWLAIAGGFAWKYGGRSAIWTLVLLSLILPLVSQLSFLGSPGQVFADSDWTTTRYTQTHILYAVVACPLWIFAAFQFRSHRLASSVTLIAWYLAICFPSWPWWIPAFASTGTLVHMAVEIGKRFTRLADHDLSWWRAAMVLFGFYGALATAAVYQPFFLRKLNISVLPRNSIQYAQIGWRECATQHRLYAFDYNFKIGLDPVVWTDDEQSRDHLRYLTKTRALNAPQLDSLNMQACRYDIRCRADIGPSCPGPKVGDYYLQEIYYGQLQPRLFFIPRSEWLISSSEFSFEQLGNYVEVFRKGEPIRQFRFYRVVPPKKR